MSAQTPILVWACAFSVLIFIGALSVIYYLADNPRQPRFAELRRTWDDDDLCPGVRKSWNARPEGPTCPDCGAGPFEIGVRKVILDIVPPHASKGGRRP